MLGPHFGEGVVKRLETHSELPRQGLQVRGGQCWLGLSCPRGAGSLGAAAVTGVSLRPWSWPPPGQEVETSWGKLKCWDWGSLTLIGRLCGHAPSGQDPPAPSVRGKVHRGQRSLCLGVTGPVGQEFRDWALGGLGLPRLLTFHPRRSAKARQPWSQSPSQATSLWMAERVRAPRLVPGPCQLFPVHVPSCPPSHLDPGPCRPISHSRPRPHL